MERPIGDKFKFMGCVYVVVKDASPDFEHSCGKCAFYRNLCLDDNGVLGDCEDRVRKDGKAVHFEYFGVDW